jgi:electron transport complex protein RnfD
MVFGKHLYGGIGFNPFNPAMLGYVMLLISFPREMTTWAMPVELLPQSLSMTKTAELIFLSPSVSAVDAISAATPLDTLRTNINLGLSIESIRLSDEHHQIFGRFAGKGWEWINLFILAGGVWLMYLRVIRWQIPVALLGSLAIIASVFYFVDNTTHSSPLFHLFSGAAMLGAFFIATDPVSASTTPKGQLIYGGGIGLLTYIIRSWGGYPDAIAFAVLLMNMAAPTIDYYTQPRVFGAGKK